MYMVTRYLGAGFVSMVMLLLLGLGGTAVAGNPTGTMDDGIYGSSDYYEETVSESPTMLETSTGGNTETNSPVPEPGTLILLTTGLAVMSGRYLRRR